MTDENLVGEKGSKAPQSHITEGGGGGGHPVDGGWSRPFRRVFVSWGRVGTWVTLKSWDSKNSREHSRKPGSDRGDQGRKPPDLMASWRSRIWALTL